MVELTIKVTDQVKAWLDAKVEGGPFESIDHALRFVLRQQRELDDPGFVYSAQDLDDMLNEARAGGTVPMPSVEEIMEAASRRAEERRRS